VFDIFTIPSQKLDFQIGWRDVFWIDGWMHGGMDGWRDGWNVWLDREREGWMDRGGVDVWKEGYMDG